MIRTAHRRLVEMTKAQVILHKSTMAAYEYGLCARDRRRLARYGVEQCRAGKSMARALSAMDTMARECFWTAHGPVVV